MNTATPLLLMPTASDPVETIKKLSRDGYAKWRRNEEAAKERRKELKKWRA